MALLKTYKLVNVGRYFSDPSPSSRISLCVDELRGLFIIPCSIRKIEVEIHTTHVSECVEVRLTPLNQTNNLRHSSYMYVEDLPILFLLPVKRAARTLMRSSKLSVLYIKIYCIE